MILRKILEAYRGLDLKTVVYSALPIYWLILLTSTFLHWSWRLQKVTELGYHPTRLASTWSIHRTRLFLLLAPRSLGPAACTLVLGYWRLRILAWSLNPWALVGMLAASSLRACKLAPSLPEFSIIFWMVPHVNVYRNRHSGWTCPSTRDSCRIRCFVQGPGTSCHPGWWLCLSTATV